MASRRPKGDGSLYFHEAKGLWVGAHVTKDGKRRYVSSKNRSKAAKKLRELQAQDAAGTLVDPSKVTVAEWLDEWLGSKAGIRPNTRRSYEGSIENHLKPRVGRVKLQALSARHIERLFADMTREGAGARTLELAHTVLCASLKHALRHRLVAASPCDLVEKPRYEAPEMRTYDPPEVTAIYDACETPFERASMRCFFGAGVRWGEYAGLKWPDLYLDEGALSIQRQLIEQPDEKGRIRLVESAPKSWRGRRKIAIGPSLVEALRNLRKEQLAGRYHASEYVFVGARGAPWRDSNWTRRVWWPLCERAGVPVITVHELRHTHATLGLMAGVDIKTMAARLGNEEVVTLKTYSHVKPDMQRAAAELLEGVLSGGAS